LGLLAELLGRVHHLRLELVDLLRRVIPFRVYFLTDLI
jgi:hypothetical protein